MPVTVSASSSKRKAKTDAAPAKSEAKSSSGPGRPKHWDRNLAKVTRVGTSAFAVASRSLSAFRRSEKPIPGDLIANLKDRAEELEKQAGYAKEEADLRLRIANAKKVIDEHRPGGVIYVPNIIKSHAGLITIIAVIMILLVFLNTC